MRFVLLTIADAANRDGEHARPGMQSMVEGSLYSEGHVRRTIAQLVAEEWIEQTQPPAPERNAEYRLPGVLGGSTPRITRGDGDSGQSSTPRERRADPARPDARRGGPESSCLFTDTDTGSESATTESVDPLRGFSEFWSVYPERRGRKLGKAKCQDLWKKLSLDDRRAAWRGAVNYAAEDTGFAKDPERFLRHRLWLDLQGPPSAGRTPPPGATPFDPPEKFEGNHVYDDPDDAE